ncbi:MAG TPA: CBU_0585 family protein [Gammaproteobacteria bacterium]|jgi:hypothetical protein|nr:CBU_0585 family protein [Gammaproteobacteria bacterium]
MSNYPIYSNFVSETDQLLQKFDEDHPELSLSQQKEIAKYQRIYRLRDEPTPSSESKTLWEKF